MFIVTTMRADSSVTIRMNSIVKQRAQKLFADLGIDMSSAVNLFIRQALSQNGLPFEVNKLPNKITLTAIADADNGKFDGEARNASELLETLNA